MRWPCVNRRKYDATRRAQRETAQALAAQMAANTELRAQLALAQADNKDLNLKLLRVGFGLSPFQEVLGAPAAAATPPETAQPLPGDFRVTAAMSPDQIQQTFALEGAHLYGNDMRSIMRHIEKRQAEHYGIGNVPSSLTEDEARQARAVQEDLLASIEEGRRNAGKVM